MDNAVDSMICYRDEIKRVLQEHAAHKPAYGDIEVELILDDARNQSGRRRPQDRSSRRRSARVGCREFAHRCLLR